MDSCPYEYSSVRGSALRHPCVQSSLYTGCAQPPRCFLYASRAGPRAAPGLQSADEVPAARAAWKPGRMSDLDPPNVSPIGLPSCLLQKDALLSVDLKAAENELHLAKRLTAGYTAAGVTLLLIWVVLAVFRYRVFSRRPARLVTDITALVLGGTATAFFVIAVSSSSQQRHYTFVAKAAEYVRSRIKSGEVPIELDQWVSGGDVVRTFPHCRLAWSTTKLGISAAEGKHIAKALELIGGARPTGKSVLFLVASILACVAVVAVVASVMSAALVVFGKAAPEDPESRTWTAPPPGLEIKTDPRERWAEMDAARR